MPRKKTLKKSKAKKANANNLQNAAKAFKAKAPDEAQVATCAHRCASCDAQKYKTIAYSLAVSLMLAASAGAYWYFY